MNIKRFGKTKEEDDILEKIKSREIVQEILNFGVTQNQITQIIGLLALELEDNQLMKNLTEVIKQPETPKIITE
jgi:hypothetical protein